MNTISLIINYASFVIVLTLIFRSFKKGNLVGFIYLTVFEYLIVGQAIHISNNLKNNPNGVLYLYHYITIDGHFLASLFLFLTTLFIALFDLFIKYKKKSNNSNSKIKYKVQVNYSYYLIIAISEILLFTFLIFQAGGVDSWLNSSRIYVSGITLFIVILGLSCYPLIIKLWLNAKINIIDIILFALSIIIIMSFSRFLSIYQLFVMVLLLIYKGQDPRKFISKYKIRIVSLFFISIIIFIGYGTYKHAINYTGSGDISDVFEYYTTNENAEILGIDETYILGIEAMSSFSGLWTEILKTNHSMFSADFGISLFVSILKIVPSFLRTPIQPLINYVSDFYYDKSIIIGPLAEMFMHFSFLGIVLYPLILVLLYRKLHLKLLNYSLNPIYLAIIAIYGLSLIRGPFVNFITYGLGQLIVAYLSIFIFKLFNKVEKIEGESKE